MDFLSTKFATQAIHIGQEPDDYAGAMVRPLYQVSTYQQSWPDTFKVTEYTRTNNPNFENVERAIAALEHGAYATVYSSGLGATLALLLQYLNSGDHVMGMNDMYGGTLRMLNKDLSRFGVTTSTIDMSDVEVVAEEIAEKKPKVIFVETPTNPQLKIVDIAAIADRAKKHNALVVVDNTFATPYFQNPLLLGADVVMHSSSKYLGGHTDIIGGILVTNDKELDAKLKYARMAYGTNPSPFDCWLLSRSLKTLPVRMEQHQKNAQIIAEYLQGHPLVKTVYYPGLSEHPNHAVARKQMSGFGGMVSAEFNLSLKQTMELISHHLHIFTLAESLGAVESLIDHPASMTHASIPKEEREKSGLTDGLVRLSVGIEDASDLQADLDNALSAFSAL